MIDICHSQCGVCSANICPRHNHISWYVSRGLANLDCDAVAVIQFSYFDNPANPEVSSTSTQFTMESKRFTHRSRPNDVVMDGSDLGDSHPGNSHFTDLLLLHSQDFGDCRTERDEREVATSIWSKVFHGRIGQFLVHSPNGPKKYEVLDQVTVVRKICEVMRNLLPLTQKKPRLVLEQLRIMQKEAKTMRAANRTMRQDLCNLTKDCGTYQREIVALRVSCDDLKNDMEEMKKGQIASTKQLTRGGRLPPSSPTVGLSPKSPHQSPSFRTEGEQEMRLRQELSVLEHRQKRQRRLLNDLLDHEHSRSPRQYGRLERPGVLAERRHDPPFPPPFIQYSDNSPRGMKRKAIDLLQGRDRFCVRG